MSPIDDSQSSLNLSNGSSINGYITSHSANAISTAGGTPTTIASGSSPLPSGLGGVLPISINGILQAANANGATNGTNALVAGGQLPGVHQLSLEVAMQQQVAAHSPSAGSGAGAMFANVPTGTRRRTTSSNSNGVGTREVHNKLEKNRRAHLKECFEQLKKQLSLQPDEKKISNLSILHAAIRHIQLLKRKEREFEHEMERLAKEKIAAQNRILLLKREITQMGDIDVSRLAPDTDITPNPSSGSLNLVAGGVQPDRDHLTENNIIGSIIPGRNGVRYSSSSSLSSIATNASIGNLPLQTTISPVLSVSSPSRGSPALHRTSTTPPSSATVTMGATVATPSSLSVSSVVPLSLTTKGSNGLASEAHNGSTQPTLKFTTAPLNGLNLSNASVVNGSVNGGSTVTVNGMTSTTAPLPVIVGANGTTNIVGITHSQLLTTTAAPSIQTLPLNLNVTSSAMSNGLSGTGGGPTSIAITTSSSGHSSGHLSAHQAALQLTTSTTNGGHVGGVANGNSITTTASGTNARTVYNAGIANGTTTLPTTATLAGTTVVTAAGLPLLAAASGKELINGTIGKNGTVRTDTSKLEIIATQPQPTNHTAAVGATAAALDPPGTKVITLMNGSTFALAPLDKDSKMGVVYSPILLPTTQGLRVIQPGSNGLATIELAPPNGGNRLQLHLTH